MNQSIIFFYDVINIPLKNTNWLQSPIYATLLGFLMAFFANFINDKIKEEKDLKQYEYILLKTTQDLLEQDVRDVKAINAFMAEFRTNLRFAKLESMKLIIDSLIKAKDGSDSSSEKKKIDERLKKLGKRGIIARIVSFLT